jgi:Na+/H+ antiporter NhaD/arsenite permease-like protein
MRGPRVDLAWLSLAALLVVVVASCTTRLNPGALAIVLARVIGTVLVPIWDKPIPVKELAAGFPVDLFLTLVGVTLLFAPGGENGTLDWAAARAQRPGRGNAALMPLLYCGLALALATVGAGNIAAAALVAPAAMATARRAGISSFLMAILVAHGAIAGALSPFSPTGIIANGLLEDRPGLKGHGWTIYWHSALANLLVALAGYVLFGGWRPLGRREHAEPEPAAPDFLRRRPRATRAAPFSLP